MLMATAFLLHRGIKGPKAPPIFKNSLLVSSGYVRLSPICACCDPLRNCGDYITTLRRCTNSRIFDELAQQVMRSEDAHEIKKFRNCLLQSEANYAILTLIL
jgi:hypothetical protein